MLSDRSRFALGIVTVTEVYDRMKVDIGVLGSKAVRPVIDGMCCRCGDGALLRAL